MGGAKIELDKALWVRVQVWISVLMASVTGRSSSPAPDSTRPRTTSRSDIRPSIDRPSPDTTRAPTPQLWSSARASETGAVGATVATSVPLADRMAATCMAHLQVPGTAWCPVTLHRRADRADLHAPVA